MLREHEKKFVNDDFLLKNTSIWKEKKKSWNSTSVHAQRLKFLVWKPRLAARQTVMTQEIFLILPCQGLSIPDILYH